MGWGEKKIKGRWMDVMDVMVWNVLDARYPCFLFLAHIFAPHWGLTPFFSTEFAVLSNDIMH